MRNSDEGLTVEQRTAVGKVRKRAEEYRVARETLHKRLMEQMVQELAAYQAARDNEVRVAYALGVRKASLKRALGSKDHATLQNILTVGGNVLLPEQEMVENISGDRFVINFVDFQGERVYGRVECVKVVTDDVVTGFEVVEHPAGDVLWQLLDDTTRVGDMTVYGLIVDAIG